MPNEQILRLTRDENQQFWRKNQGQKFWNSFNAKKSHAKILAKSQFFDKNLAITN